MGRYNFSALRVHRRALQSLDARQTSTRPAWLDIVGEIPPAQVFVRRQPKRHSDVRRVVRTIPPNPNAPRLPDGSALPARTEVHYEEVNFGKEPKMTLKPRRLVYQEDKLRERFYRDHPWELARPRILIETDGRDADKCDWSKGIEQHQNGKKLDGESVIQRTLHLSSTVPDISPTRAYDTARHEFYSARHQEDVERRVAAEEARYTGAQFEPDILRWSMQLEDEAYDDWERWARQQVIEREQRRAAFAGGSGSGPGGGAAAGPNAVSPNGPSGDLTDTVLEDQLLDTTERTSAVGQRGKRELSARI